MTTKAQVRSIRRLRRRADGVEAVAAQLGEHTGTCPACARPVRLTAVGLIPPHHNGVWCPGSEQEPAERPGCGTCLTPWVVS